MKTKVQMFKCPKFLSQKECLDQPEVRLRQTNQVLVLYSCAGEQPGMFGKLGVSLKSPVSKSLILSTGPHQENSNNSNMRLSVYKYIT